jgi:hypothetical protein
MRNDKEYQLCKAISIYLKLQYPNVLYHFDYAGLNLSIEQASKMKAIQGKIGYPDLFIMQPTDKYHGLFIEIKHDFKQVYASSGFVVNKQHILEQLDYIEKLESLGYYACFGYSFENIRANIDLYLLNY